MNTHLFKQGRDEDGDNSTADYIRVAANCCLYYWPNDGRDDTRLEMLRSFFSLVRANLKHGNDIQSAVARLENDSFRYADM